MKSVVQDVLKTEGKCIDTFCSHTKTPSVEKVINIGSARKKLEMFTLDADTY